MIKRLLITLITLSSTLLIAQSNNSSPYSIFGIGQEFNRLTVEQASMGGIGTAFKSDRYLNFTNPAANANLRFATYTIGGDLTFLTLKEATSSQSGSVANLKYISLGFPIGKKAGFSAGIQPKTSVGYSLLNEVFDENDDLIEVTNFTGDGGANKLYGGFGYEVIKGLSLGLKFLIFLEP